MGIHSQEAKSEKTEDKQNMVPTWVDCYTLDAFRRVPEMR